MAISATAHFASTASAAAIPAAWPKAKQVGITRAEESATWLADRVRPATSKLLMFCGTRQR